MVPLRVPNDPLAAPLSGSCIVPVGRPFYYTLVGVRPDGRCETSGWRQHFMAHPTRCSIPIVWRAPAVTQTVLHYPPPLVRSLLRWSVRLPESVSVASNDVPRDDFEEAPVFRTDLGAFIGSEKPNVVMWRLMLVFALGATRAFVDGEQYFRALYHALQRAQHTIFICDWWLSPEVLLVRWRANDGTLQGVSLLDCLVAAKVCRVPPYPNDWRRSTTGVSDCFFLTWT